MSKDAYIAAHEELTQEFLRDHPEMTWQQAYDATADAAWDRMRDSMADWIDAARQRLKDEGKAAPIPFRSAEDARRFAQAIIDLGTKRNAEIARGKR
jgi:hypothetical protein